MATPFQTAFAAVQSSLGTSVTGTITRGSDTVAVICSGIDGLRAQDEFGRIIGKSGYIRYDQDNEPSTAILEGDNITLTRNSDSSTEALRVVGRKASGKVVTLTVEGKYE